MNKAELVKTLAEKTDLTQNEATRIFEATLDIMSATLVQGETITLNSFGVFSPRHHKERIGRNPQNGDIHMISARNTVNFRPSKLLKDSLNA